MEKGNEGDEILFLALRQIDCPIPAEIVKVGQIEADLFVGIITRCLLLITDGEAQFPFVLPQNIAARHRTCTSVAAKVKELGYLNDCGYNQLLYPAEGQTRDLLKWLVEKLPRTEEEGAQEVLGANALMNKRIMESLKVWKHKPYQLPFCSKGTILRNVYDHSKFRTIPGLLDNADESKTLTIFRKASDAKLPVECSLLERHALEHIADAKYAQRLEQDFADAQAAAEDADGELGIGETKKEVGDGRKNNSGNSLTQQAIRAALLKAVQSGSSGSGGVDGGAGGTNRSAFAVGANDAALAKGLSTSMADLLQGIADGHLSALGTKQGQSGERGTRFSHAMEYGQEAAATAALAATMTGKVDAAAMKNAGSSSGASRVGSTEGGRCGGFRDGKGQTASGHDTEEEEDPANSGAGSACGGASRRKRNTQELEELARQEELESLRSEVQQYSSTVETIVRNQQNAAARTKQYEEDLQSLQEETERREKEVLLKKRTLEMLPSARDNIAKLQELGTAGTQRMLDLAQEWERHRQPLVDALMEKEDILNKRREKGRLMVEEVKRYRAEMSSMIQDLKDKQDRMQILNEETAKLNKNINRAMYTHRIMDITNQIVKQNKDIDKITADIRDIQKTINLNSSTLQRADAIAEELIFAAANDRNDPVMVDTYRRLKTLRSKFEELVETVGKIGQQEKANRDLETKIDQEQSRVSSNNSERINADLEAIIQENALLVAQIKSASVKTK